MKRIILLCPFLFACAHTPSHPLLRETSRSITTDYKPLRITGKAHNDYIVTGRCGEGDGPKQQATLLDVTNPAVIASELWVDTKSKNILERIVFNYKSQEVSMELSQGGCSHFGWTYTYYVNESYPYQDTNKAVNEAVNMIQYGHNQKMYRLHESDLEPLENFKKNILVKVDVYTPKKGSKIENKHICEKSDFQILCSSYNDPVNYEIMIRKTENKGYSVQYNYWYVM